MRGQFRRDFLRVTSAGQAGLPRKLPGSNPDRRSVRETGHADRIGAKLPGSFAQKTEFSYDQRRGVPCGAPGYDDRVTNRGAARLSLIAPISAEGRRHAIMETGIKLIWLGKNLYPTSQVRSVRSRDLTRRIGAGVSSGFVSNGGTTAPAAAGSAADRTEPVPPEERLDERDELCLVPFAAAGGGCPRRVGGRRFPNK